MNAEKEIIEGLSAPIKTFRIYALEQSIARGGSPELLGALLEMGKSESDEECLIILPHAIDAVKTRCGKSAEVQIVCPTVEKFPEVFASTGVVGKLRLLAALHPDWLKTLIQWAQENFQIEKDPAVASQILKKFRSLWPADRFNILAPFLFSGFLSVRFAVLETFIAAAPFRLQEHLPGLLTDDDPRIRALAIRGLAKIDSDEAQSHMDGMLLGKDPLKKLAFLQSCVVLPFRLVKVPLLKFLSVEPELSLLEKAGLPFQINPDPEVPYRLLEIIDQAHSRKISILKEIFEGACKIIQDSGIQKEKFSVYISRLEEAVMKRKALRFVRNELVLLDSDDPAEREEGESAIRRNQAKPMVLEALKAVEKLPMVVEQAKKVELILKTDAPVQPDKNKFDLKAFNLLSETEQLRMLAGLQAEDLKTGAGILPVLLRDDKFSEAIHLVALRAAIRIGADGFSDLASAWLSHRNENLVASSLEYLGKFSPDKSLQVLPRLLKSSSARVKGSALKVLRQHDPMQAVSFLMTLLKNSDRGTRSSILPCLLNFDFSLLRDPLVDLLESRKDVSLLDVVLCLFQSNPHPENLFLLFRMEKAFPPEISKRISAVRQENEVLIESLKILDVAELKLLSDSFEGKLKDLMAKKASPPPYSYKSLHFDTQILWEGSAKFAREILKPLAAFALAGFMAINLLIFLFRDRNVPIEKSVQSGGILAEPIEISGKVTGKIDPGNEILVTTEDQTIFQLPLPEWLGIPKDGEQIRATIKPFRQVDGRILARFVEFKK